MHTHPRLNTVKGVKDNRFVRGVIQNIETGYILSAYHSESCTDRVSCYTVDDSPLYHEL